MKKKLKTKKKGICECCKQKIDIVFGGTRYCTNCVIYIQNMRQSLIYYKTHYERLKKLGVRERDLRRIRNEKTKIS